MSRWPRSSEVPGGEQAAADVVGPHRVAGRGRDLAGHHHERDTGGEVGECRAGHRGAHQDQRLAAVGQQAGDGGRLVAAGSGAAERDLVTEGAGRGVQGLDDLAVELVLQAEDHADQTGPAAAEQARPVVGGVAEPGGRVPHAPARRLAGPGLVPEDDGDQRPGHPGVGRHVRHGRCARTVHHAAPSSRLLIWSLRWSHTRAR